MSKKLKSVIITNYVQGLASYLDEENIKWEQVADQVIRIYYTNDEHLFKIGMGFGQFFESEIYKDRSED